MIYFRLEFLLPVEGAVRKIRFCRVVLHDIIICSRYNFPKFGRFVSVFCHVAAQHDLREDDWD